jgi:glycosyltransferase involved in cell wall biosynthesis
VIRIAHVTTGLHPEGAEIMLLSLISGMDPARFSNEVISLTDLGAVGPRLQAAGVRVRALGMRPGIPNPYHLLRLASWLKKSQPQIVQTWMYHADLMGGVAARLAGKSAVVWGIHHTDLEPCRTKRLTIWTARACARLSHHIPKRIVCCSDASRRVHAGFGYAEQKMEVIYNGFDLRQFQPDAGARISLRRELGLSAGTPLVGMAARFHPQKDHQNFVEAAARLHAWAPDVHFLLCGRDVNRENQELMSWINARPGGLGSVCHLLGIRKDMPRVFAALDLATLSSVTEAFPIAIGEAMGCGTLCVVTDVGDSAAIVGDTGKVVPPNDPQALAEAWREVLAMGPAAREQMGLAARQRVEGRFGIGAIVERYQELYQRVLATSDSVAAKQSGVASLAQ